MISLKLYKAYNSFLSYMGRQGMFNFKVGNHFCLVFSKHHQETGKKNFQSTKTLQFHWCKDAAHTMLFLFDEKLLSSAIKVTPFLNRLAGR